MSTLFPAVKALGKGYCDRIFYLTAKTVTGREAYAAAAKLYEAGSGMRTVVITAKEQACIQAEGSLSGGLCFQCRKVRAEKEQSGKGRDHSPDQGQYVPTKLSECTQKQRA